MEREIWKDILGYEGLYQASNLGRIKSIDRVVRYGRYNTNLTAVKIGKLRKQHIIQGYHRVTLFNNGKPKSLYVHRLVWSAFNGKIPDGMEVNHINEVKTDNRLENLNLMSRNENINYGTRNERVSAKMTNGKLSKKVSQYDLNGNYIKEWESVAEVQRKSRYLQSGISACCRGEQKTAYGYIWKYTC